MLGEEDRKSNKRDSGRFLFNVNFRIESGSRRYCTVRILIYVIFIIVDP